MTEYPEIWSDEVDLQSLVPYGFLNAAGPGSSAVEGFPVFFDINLNKTKAAELFQALVDGRYLDPDFTQRVDTTMLLFNPELGLFTLVQVTAMPSKTGGTTLSSDMALFDPDFYDWDNNPRDLVRTILECLCVPRATNLSLLFS